jgi:hypothetical protein
VPLMKYSSLRRRRLPTTAPSANPAQVEEAQYREILNTMTLEEKLGQLLVVGYSEANHAETMIKEHNIGGIVLFSRKLR